ncbi:beta-lactamase/transpeptidase-like protein [Coprinellus micaceus]|uniref:Beta-lactamase/transpeptidase-like protein n=1 Tax=Coprinellus micaceus TaxID=71717 RepID=A0A4Y7SWH8_COPMI|nr:beta-lactamase/transpeptidase-like protein [Coprinellus micaceus]
MVRLSTPGKRSIDEYMDQLSQDSRVPPFVFGVTACEEGIYLRGSGSRVVGDPASGQVDGDTGFWICSEGKPITHLAALQLMERGLLSIDTPVSDLFPEFKSCVIVENSDITGEPSTLYRPAKQTMTVEHLMHHTSGLFYSSASAQDWDSDLSNPYSYPQSAEDPVGEFLRWIKGDYPGIPLKFEPGLSWAYGWSSDILGFVIERASGMNLEEYLQTNIFKPLSMSRTSFYRTPVIKENLISISFRREAGGGAFEPWKHRFYEVDPEKVHLFCGGGHLISSSRDYLTFLRHLLQILAGATEPPNAIISRTALERFLSPSLDVHGQEAIQAFLQSSIPPSNVPSVQWANGQAITTIDWEGRRKRGSGFWMGFLNLFYWIDPTTGVAAVLQAQYLPPLDGTMGSICEEFEQRLYAGLEEENEESGILV